jgi:hypothetical protein
VRTSSVKAVAAHSKHSSAISRYSASLYACSTALQAGALPSSQPPAPDQRSLPVMFVCGVVGSEAPVSKDVPGELGLA